MAKQKIGRRLQGQSGCLHRLTLPLNRTKVSGHCRRHHSRNDNIAIRPFRCYS